MRRTRDRDDGNLMLLSGILVTIAFVLTALTLAEVSALERQAASDSKSGLLAEWRFLHDRLANNLAIAVTPELRNVTLHDTTLPAVVGTFRSLEAQKGYDLLAVLASSSVLTNKTEANLVSGTHYSATAVTGDYTYTQEYDGVNDGILWWAPCPHPNGASTGCISGLLLHVRLTDGASSIEEVMLFAVNRP